MDKDILKINSSKRHFVVVISLDEATDYAKENLLFQEIKNNIYKSLNDSGHHFSIYSSEVPPVKSDELINDIGKIIKE